MKITMYELLGMIKDGKVPKRIIYDEYVYQWNNIIKNYEREVDIDTTLNWDYIAIECLNEKVEILEEEKKIPEKIEYYDDSIAWVIDDVGQLSDVDKVIIDKLNDVIDYLKSKGE